MNFDIIKHQIGNIEINSISARELHEKLQVKSRFNDWINNRIKKYCFIENEDFIAITKNLVTAQGNNSNFLDYIVTIDMAKELAMVENNEIGRDIRRYFIQIEKKYREELYNKQDSFQERKEQFQLDIIGLESSFKLLRINEASKILMTKTLYTEHGLSTSYLPKYSDEQHTYSLSHLLKKFEVGISAKKLNLILLSENYLEIKTRKSTDSLLDEETKEKKPKLRTFKSLTEKGLEFGKNMISPHNQLETSPHYFESKFSELITSLKL